MAARSGHHPQIAFLLGKPIESGSLLSDVIERLHHRWPTIIVHRVSNDTPLPSSVFDADLVVQRGLAHQLITTSTLHLNRRRQVSGVAMDLPPPERSEVEL